MRKSLKMTSAQLRELQERIKFDAPSMAACLGLKLHCYRKYLYGENPIPEIVARHALELENINAIFINDLPKRVDAAADKEFPHGIMSEFIP